MQLITEECTELHNWWGSKQQLSAGFYRWRVPLLFKCLHLPSSLEFIIHVFALYSCEMIQSNLFGKFVMTYSYSDFIEACKSCLKIFPGQI